MFITQFIATILALLVWDVIKNVTPLRAWLDKQSARAGRFGRRDE